MAESENKLLAEDPQARQEIRDLKNALISVVQTAQELAAAVDRIIDNLPDLSENARLRERERALTEALAGLAGRFAVRCEEGWRCTECGQVLSGWHCAEGCEVGQARAAVKEEETTT